MKENIKLGLNEDGMDIRSMVNMKNRSHQTLRLRKSESQKIKEKRKFSADVIDRSFCIESLPKKFSKNSSKKSINSGSPSSKSNSENPNNIIDHKDIKDI